MSLFLPTVADADSRSRLLLHTARFAPDPDQTARLADDVQDWNGLVEASLFHGTLPALHEAFAAAPEARVPPQVRGLVERYYRENAVHALRIAADLREVLAAAEAAGLRVTPVKGWSLAARYYEGLGRRKLGDLDVLVAPEEAVALIEVAKELGYTSKPDLFAQSADVDVLREAGRHHLALLRGAGTHAMTMLEVHWALLPQDHRLPLREGHALETPRLLAHAREEDIDGATVWQLAPEDHLLFLVLHGLKHRWMRLYGVQDVDRLLRNEPDLDVNLLLERTMEPYGVCALAPALHLAKRLLETPLSAPLNDYLDDQRRRRPWLLRSAEAALLRQLDAGVLGWTYHLARQALTLLSATDPRQRLRVSVPLARQTVAKVLGR